MIPEFASEAYIVEFNGRSVCIDAGLAGLLSIGFRILALVYPPGACRQENNGLPVLQASLAPDALFEQLASACREALEVYARFRRRSLLRRLLSPPSREELLSGEAYHALMVCRELGLSEARLEASREGFYIVYRRGSSEWKRLHALNRVEEGALFERLTGILNARG